MEKVKAAFADETFVKGLFELETVAASTGLGYGIADAVERRW